MHQNLLALLVLLTAAVVAVSLARRFKLPAILAYLAVGIALGPHGAQVLRESAQVDGFAEFGVVFLMFSIGLEFSLPRLKAMRALVFGFGGAQMLLTAAGAALVAGLGYGQDWRAGLAIGLAVAMSSTAIVAKLLSERFELHSRSGRQTMGVLLFQDLAVVPCLILLPALANPAEDMVAALSLALLAGDAGSGRTDLGRTTTHAPAVRHGRRAPLRGAVRAGHALDRHRPGLRHRRRRTVAGTGRLRRRHADFGNHLPPPGRGRHPAVPRHPARPVLRHRRHDARPRLSC